MASRGGDNWQNCQTQPFSFANHCLIQKYEPKPKTGYSLWAPISETIIFLQVPVNGLTGEVRTRAKMDTIVLVQL